MGVSADEIATHGDKDHGLRDVDALFVIEHQASPAGHPVEGALNAVGRDLEALLVVATADGKVCVVIFGGAWVLTEITKRLQKGHERAVVNASAQSPAHPFPVKAPVDRARSSCPT